MGDCDYCGASLRGTPSYCIMRILGDDIAFVFHPECLAPWFREVCIPPRYHVLSVGAIPPDRLN